jgi:hypothetical protein
MKLKMSVNTNSQNMLTTPPLDVGLRRNSYSVKNIMVHYEDRAAEL